MPRKLICSVTAEMLKKFRRGEFLCPVDAAIRAAGVKCFVGQNTWIDLDTGETHPLPNKAKKFIRRWDAGHSGLQPFDFEIHV